MAIKSYKPTSPGRRQGTVVEYKSIVTKSKPEKSLTKPKLGCTKHPVDDVIGTTDAIVDQVRSAVGTRDK